MTLIKVSYRLTYGFQLGDIVHKGVLRPYEYAVQLVGWFVAKTPDYRFCFHIEHQKNHNVLTFLPQLDDNIDN